MLVGGAFSVRSVFEKWDQWSVHVRPAAPGTNHIGSTLVTAARGKNMDINNFQRVGSSSNTEAGRLFEEAAHLFFSRHLV
jgi:hypothetical protein